MKFINLHIVQLSRATLVAIFVASSGFTAILHNCTMKAATCCSDSSEEVSHKDCDEGLPTNLESSIQFNAVCHTNTLVGGMTTNPAVVEKENKYQQTKLSIVADIILVDCFQTSALNLSPLFGHTTATVSPPSVEKYVLNASFRI